MSQDEVTDYLIIEAVTLKAKKEEQKAQKEAEDAAKREQFKKESQEKLNQFR